MDHSSPVRVWLTRSNANARPVAESFAVVGPEDTPFSITPQGSDLEGASLTGQIVIGPTQGTVTTEGDQWIYRPATNWSGSDSLSYRVWDGTQWSARNGIVTITVQSVNDPPVGGADAFTMMEGGSGTITLAEVLANDTDVDGPQSLSVVGFGQTVQHGTLRINPLQQSVTYTPADNFSGTDSFSYLLSDGLDTAPVAVSLTVVNVDDDPPVIAAPRFDCLAWSTEAVTVAAPGLLGEGTYHYSDIFDLRSFDGPIRLSGAIEWRWVGDKTMGDSWTYDHS